MSNPSIVRVLRGEIERVRKLIEDADDEIIDRYQLHQLADAAEDLMLSIQDRIGTSSEAYSNASQGGP